MALKVRASAAGRARAVRVEAKQWANKGGVLIPPAWNKRVVVPEVEPRDTPKVSLPQSNALSTPTTTPQSARARARMRAISTRSMRIQHQGDVLYPSDIARARRTPRPRRISLFYPGGDERRRRAATAAGEGGDGGGVRPSAARALGKK